MSDDFSPQDGLAILRAEIDQLVAVAPELARAARGLYDAFRSEGFNDHQALYLVAVQFKDSPGTAA